MVVQVREPKPRFYWAPSAMMSWLVMILEPQGLVSQVGCVTCLSFRTGCMSWLFFTSTENWLCIPLLDYSEMKSGPKESQWRSFSHILGTSGTSQGCMVEMKLSNCCFLKCLKKLQLGKPQKRQMSGAS